ncbi:hypothetical protein [Halopelagius longus]|uniref:Uncharacterized protein n=1 Tax=Halopelagius longus TaxID=1236180 RepID=A0A1H1C955_9EURY|nr:hypothetical protein [Halopelagius longus]SDQ60747.1 hypothetical protein SAMN05216278_2182 [Halopelagius longus]
MAESDAVTGRFGSQAWRAGAATGVGYLLVLAAMFLVLFVVPYLVFGAL